MSQEQPTETRLALVELSISRFDSIIEKLADVSSSLREMMAVHANRIEQQERAEVRLDVKLNKEIGVMDERLKKNETEVDKKLTHISDGMDELKATLATHNTSVLNEIKEVEDNLDVRFEKWKEARKEESSKLSARLDTINKYIWIAMGVALAIGVGIDKLGHLVKIGGL